MDRVVVAPQRLVRPTHFGGRSITGAGAPVSQIESIRLQHRSSILRNVVRPDRLPHFQVHLPASNSGSAVGDWWSGICYLSIPTARILSVRPLYRFRRRPRGNTIRALADREGCERSTMEGAGQRGFRVSMAAPINISPTQSENEKALMRQIISQQKMERIVPLQPLHKAAFSQILSATVTVSFTLPDDGSTRHPRRALRKEQRAQKRQQGRCAQKRQCRMNVFVAIAPVSFHC